MEDSLVITWGGLSVRQAQGCCWYARCPTFTESRGLRCQKLWDCSTLSRWATLAASGEPARIHGNASQDLLWVLTVLCVSLCGLQSSTQHQGLSSFPRRMPLRCFSARPSRICRGRKIGLSWNKSSLITDSWAGVAAKWPTAFALWAHQVTGWFG